MAKKYIIPDKSNYHLVKKGKSKIHGTGVFAVKKIPKNTKIVHYNGEKIDSKESDRREERYDKRGQIWTFEISRRWYVDAHVGGGIAKYVNHSDKPNCWIDIKGEEIWYRAAKTIYPRQELTVDYGTTEFPGYSKS